MSAILSVRGLKKRFKRPVVDGVDLDVFPGEIVGLLGPNGAGKTTTFRMTVGMFAADAGTVEFLGQDVTSWAMHRRARAGMGYQPQQHSVFRDLSTEKNLLVVLERLSLSRRDRLRRCDELLEEYGLGATRTQRAGTLSGGQMRRLEIARALIMEPRLMLFDEPFAGVDPIAVGDIQEIVYGLKDKGIAIFITDHQAAQILSTSDRVYLMHEGRVVVHGSPREILDSALARKVYLGENFKLDLDDGGPAPAESPSAGKGLSPAESPAAGEGLSPAESPSAGEGLAPPLASEPEIESRESA